MIEDKKEGIKVAENKEEAFWKGICDKCMQTIENCRHEIELNETIKAHAEYKLKVMSESPSYTS